MKKNDIQESCLVREPSIKARRRPQLKRYETGKPGFRIARVHNPRLDHARHLIAESLSRLEDGWVVEETFVRGPSATAVHVAELHGRAPAHLDVGFILDRTRSDAHVIWDCTSGIGATDEAKLSRAVETWIRSTAPVFLEFRNRQGRFADHYEANDRDGFTGWHAIHGPFLGWGIGEGKDALQRWALGRPLLPQLRSSVEPSLDPEVPNGVKLFFGNSPQNETAEVRINGNVVTGPSSALAALDWPRSSKDSFMRAFVLLIRGDRYPAARITSKGLRPLD
jgi:hypothetical protein